jgi:hypothetical protein
VKYVLEVHPNPKLQPDVGYFHHGQGTKTESLHVVERPHALTMNLDFAKKRAAVCRSQGHRARILTSEGHRVVVDWEAPLTNEDQGLTLHNAHERSVWRDKVDGKTVEIPLIYNRATRTWYLAFSTSPHSADPPDLSIAGPSPEAVFQRFVGNPHWKSYVDRFVVEDLVFPVPTATPTQTAPNEPQLELPQGYEIVGLRPGDRT